MQVTNLPNETKLGKHVVYWRREGDRLIVESFTGGLGEVDDLWAVVAVAEGLTPVFGEAGDFTDCVYEWYEELATLPDPIEAECIPTADTMAAIRSLRDHLNAVLGE